MSEPHTANLMAVCFQVRFCRSRALAGGVRVAMAQKGLGARTCSPAATPFLPAVVSDDQSHLWLCAFHLVN